MDSDICKYCMEKGKIRADKSEGGLEADLYICDECFYLLKKPETALPLIRGTLVNELRGKMPSKQLDEAVNAFMGLISKWELKN